MNMAAITASLERSLNKCSLNAEAQTHAVSRSSSSSLDLNSQLSLPYHWEQCLDLKSGEVYYINWRTGRKSKEDPRSGGELSSGEFYSEDEDGDDDDDDDDDSSSSYDDDDESSTQSSPNSYSRLYDKKQEEEEEDDDDDSDGVLVVAGCKICLMYFMVPKQDAHCPKCSAQLLHFDTSSASASAHTIPA